MNERTTIVFRILVPLSLPALSIFAYQQPPSAGRTAIIIVAAITAVMILAVTIAQVFSRWAKGAPPSGDAHS